MNKASNRLSIVHDSDILEQMDRYLNQLEEHKHPHDRTFHIPDFFLCRITDDFMEEPVIIESGFTYEKTAI